MFTEVGRAWNFAGHFAMGSPKVVIGLSGHRALQLDDSSSGRQTVDGWNMATWQKVRSEEQNERR